MESEYYAAALGGKEAMYMQKILWEMLNMKCLHFSEVNIKFSPVELYIDNLSCLNTLKHDGFKSGIKHLRISQYWIKQEIQNGTFVLKFCPTNLMKADMLTKPLARVKLNRNMNLLQMELSNESREGK
jgi:hypothetical protein